MEAAISTARRQAAGSIRPGWCSRSHRKSTSTPESSPSDAPCRMGCSFAVQPASLCQNFVLLVGTSEIMLQFQPALPDGLTSASEFLIEELTMRRSSTPALSFLACIVVAVFAFFVNTSWAATETPVYSFTGGLDGGNPASQLIFDGAGNAYGTTVIGGSANCGTVFELTRNGEQWQQMVLYSFGCFSDGKNPYGGLTMDAQHNLYGT